MNSIFVLAELSDYTSTITDFPSQIKIVFSNDNENKTIVVIIMKKEFGLIVLFQLLNCTSVFINSYKKNITVKDALYKILSRF
ncbi:hypothetical protein D3C86_1942350 [compost metagenome]